jgi:Type II secretion system (T2SS), protein E, N-terminal domain
LATYRSQFVQKLARLKKLGELLTQESLISEADLRLALDEQKKTGALLGEILVSHGRVSEWDLARCLVSQLQLPFVYTTNFEISPEALALLPHPFLHQHRIVPLDIFGKTLVIATAGSLSQDVVEEIEITTQLEVMLCIALATDILKTLQDRFPLERVADALSERFDSLYNEPS